MNVRKAELRDLDAIVAIEHGVFDSDQLSRASLRRYAQVPSVAMLVAEEAGRVLGYTLVGFRRGSKKARLYSIAVAPDGAGRGVGRALLEASEAAAASRTCTTLGLEVRADNPRAIALYEKAGYCAAGSEEEYYEDGATALRFEKILTTRHAA